MVGVEEKDSTITKLGRGAKREFKLRSETYFDITVQFVISLSLPSTTTIAPTISRTKW
jgi:hypothetical protein